MTGRLCSVVHVELQADSMCHAVPHGQKDGGGAPEINGRRVFDEEALVAGRTPGEVRKISIG